MRDIQNKLGVKTCLMTKGIRGIYNTETPTKKKLKNTKDMEKVFLMA